MYIDMKTTHILARFVIEYRTDADHLKAWEDSERGLALLRPPVRKLFKETNPVSIPNGAPHVR